MNIPPPNIGSNPPIPSTTAQISSSASAVGDNISNAFGNLSQSVSSTVSKFSEQAEAGVGASSGFLQSNTIIAKFAFLILVIIVFLFLLNLGITIIQYFQSSSNSPYLVKGMINGNNSMTIPQDPLNGDSILIKRSNNEPTGLEFTWSTWVFVNELNAGTEFQHIFSKGNSSFNEKGLADVNNAPGLYLKQNASSVDNAANTASLHVIVNTNTSPDNSISIIDDIPLKKWVNVIIRMQNTVMDTYINGTVSARRNLEGVPMQNYHDVLVCQNGGFNGNLSNLRYYDEALNIFEINKIVANGPDTSASDSDKYLAPTYNYLSSMWYTAKL